jgi:AcrR family transcriptional regulator
MSQQRGEDTRARILDAAVRKFALAGYDSASVEDICGEAGVSKGAFYHHFPSKQAIFLALMQGWLSMIDLGFNTSKGETVPQTLLHMTDLLPAIFASAEDRLPMFLEFWMQASRDETIWKAIIAPYHHYQEHFEKMFIAGMEEGSIKPINAKVASQVIVSLAVGLLLQGVLDPRGADWAETSRDGIEMFLNGIAKA